MKVSIHCPFCHQQTSLDPAPVKVRQGRDEWHVGAIWEKDHARTWWIGVCNYCERPVLVLNRGAEVYPAPVPKPTDKAVPEPIREDLDEAKRCLFVKAWRASVVMARRAMQSAAIDKGMKPGARLIDQIEQMKNAGMITSDLKEWADVVRWAGNDAAHPGGEYVSKEDAEVTLSLAEQFLHVVYVTPALAKSMRLKQGK